MPVKRVLKHFITAPKFKINLLVLCFTNGYKVPYPDIFYKGESVRVLYIIVYLVVALLFIRNLHASHIFYPCKNTFH